MSQALASKVVVVTGASQGIGAATAEILAERGAAVALLSRSAERLAEVASTIKDHGGQALPLVVDVANPAQVAAAFAYVAAELGPVDILVNSAGYLVNVPFADMTVEQWDQVIATNLRGTMLCCQAAFGQMAGRGGTILNLSSLSGVKNIEKFPGLSAYVASKFAVAGLTESLAVEGRPMGIRVLAVSPGAVDTPMLRAAAPHLKPAMTPRDLAEILAFLVSDAGQHLSGTNLEIFSNA